jgi:hypothetical protein
LCLRSHKSSSWFENSGRDQIIGGEEKGNKLDMLLGHKKIKIFQTPVNGFCEMEWKSGCLSRLGRRRVLFAGGDR